MAPFLVVPLLFATTYAALAQDPDAISATIRDEAIRANQSVIGYPLPLAAHWNTGGLPGGFDPIYQLNKISKGDYLILSLGLGPDQGACTPDLLAYYQTPITQAANQKLPVAFMSGQWDGLLTGGQFLALPATQNPNVINLDNTIRGQLDPMGPVQPWRDAGTLWGSSGCLQQMQAWYPDPPLVIFVSNNEASRIPWTDANSSLRYVNAYGTNTIESYKRDVFGAGWIERDRALHDAFRAALVNATWRANAVFDGYNAFGPRHFGRWPQWYYFALPFGNYIDPSPFAWNGGSPPFFLFDWDPSRDDQVWGPQIEGLNWIPMLQEALTINPSFRFGITTWDGGATKRQQLSDIIPFTEDRYAAMVQFGMWSLRPRLVHEFRDWNDTVANSGSWFDAVLNVIRNVYENPTLRAFWRSGQLVPNHAWQHPYQQLVQYVAAGSYATADRWFLLDTTVDPPHPYTPVTRLPVLAIALQMGTVPNRQWLLYAHAPMGDRTNVGITIPGYTQVFVNVPVRGAFYLTREGIVGVQPIDVTLPAIVSVAPATGSGQSQMFTFTYRDMKGGTDLVQAEMLFSSTGAVTSACDVKYDATSHTFSLLADNATTALVLPPSGSVTNSQCAIQSAGTSAAVLGTDLTLTVNITFTPAFTGTKGIFARVQDAAGNGTPLLRLGAWTVVSDPDLPTMRSLSPTSGTGPAQVFQAVYRDPRGGTDLEWVQLLISNGSASSACYLHYQVASRTLFMFDDTAQTATFLASPPGSIENSQCVLFTDGSSASTDGTDLTLRVNVSFKGSFAGQKNIYMQAKTIGGKLGFWVLMGTWQPLGSAPQPLSITPATGSGSTATLTGVFHYPGSATYLTSAQFLIGHNSTPNSCWVIYETDSNKLLLVPDSGQGAAYSVAIGSGRAENSQCILWGQGFSAVLSGSDLTVTIRVTFKPEFAGSKTVALYAQGRSGPPNSWAQGTWDALGDPNLPYAVSLSPSSGSGSAQVFTATYRDPNGVSDLVWAQLLIAGSQGDSRNACYIHYQRSSNTLVLFDDQAHDGFAVIPGSAQSAANSQCVVQGATSSVSLSGTQLVLSVSVRFRAGFADLKGVYLQIIDSTGNLSPWRLMGTWSALADPNLPSNVSVSPSGGSGYAQTFRAVYQDPNGAGTLAWAQLLVSASGGAQMACFVHYNVAGNSFFLFNDTADGGQWLAPGAGVAQNSQCVLKGSGSSATLSGTDLTVTVEVEFLDGFAGSKSVYMITQDRDGNAAPARLLGSWTAVQNPNIPQVLSLSPNAGAGPSSVFTGIYRDPNGAVDLQWVQLLITGDGSAIAACYVHYQRATNTLFLYDDQAVAGSGLVPGSNRKVSNGQCTIVGRTSMALVSGTDLTLLVDVEFARGFAGGKAICMQGKDLEGNVASWRPMGTWTVQ